jgi:hypothetical protein
MDQDDIAVWHKTTELHGLIPTAGLTEALMGLHAGDPRDDHEATLKSINDKVRKLQEVLDAKERSVRLQLIEELHAQMGNP